MSLVAHGADREREDKALLELRAAVQGLGIKTKSSQGNYEYFSAYLRDENNVLVDSVFVTVYGGQFSWSRDGKYPLTDIEGAAVEIARIVCRNGSSGAESSD